MLGNLAMAIPIDVHVPSFQWSAMVLPSVPRKSSCAREPVTVETSGEDEDIDFYESFLRAETLLRDFENGRFVDVDDIYVVLTVDFVDILF